MDQVNKTLYIPLYGKALVSRRGIILKDEKAEQIWAREGFRLKGKSASPLLALYMGMRARVFDDWLAARMEEDPGAVVLHLGCGLDSRISRVGSRGHAWFDVDMPQVIEQRKRHYSETEEYHMLGGKLEETDWLERIRGEHAIVVMEGVSMYLQRETLLALLTRLRGKFEKIELLLDCYTEKAAKISKYKNPVNDVGVTQLYGLDEPLLLQEAGLQFLQELDMTPQDLIEELKGAEKWLFRHLCAGKFAGSLYRMYWYRQF